MVLPMSVNEPFDFVKSSLMSEIPLERRLRARETSEDPHWDANRCDVIREISHRAEKPAQQLFRGRYLPVKYRIYLVWVHPDAMIIHDAT